MTPPYRYQIRAGLTEHTTISAETYPTPEEARWAGIDVCATRADGYYCEVSVVDAEGCAVAVDEDVWWEEEP